MCAQCDGTDKLHDASDLCVHESNEVCACRANKRLVNEWKLVTSVCIAVSALQAVAITKSRTTTCH